MNPVIILEIVVGLGLLIMIHELGHFFAAKWAGVRVDKLALGLGPKILWVKRGETEYSIRAIPLGGFCAMAGEEPGSESEAPLSRQFRGQPPGKRAVILVSGVFLNFILGIVLFSIAFGVGVEFTRPIVGAIETNSPAEKAGIQPGDEIIAVNGDRDIDWTDVVQTVMMSDLDGSVTFTIDREGEVFDVTCGFQRGRDTDLPAIGVRPATGRTITFIKKNGPADKAGLKVGDVIDTVGGTRFLNWGDAHLYLEREIGKPVPVVVDRKVERGTETVTEKVTVDLVAVVAKRGSIGIAPASFPKVAAVLPNGPAEKAGVKVGDEILAVNGIPTPCGEDIISGTGRNAGIPVEFTFRRAGELEKMTITPELDAKTKRGLINMVLAPNQTLIVGAVEPGSAADKAGVKPGDVLTSLNGQALTSRKQTADWDDVEAIVTAAARSGDKEITVGWLSGKAAFEKTVVLEAVEDPFRGSDGLAVEPEIQMMRKYPIQRAPVIGLKKSWQMVGQVYLFLRKLVTGNISPKFAAGPVGIATISYKVAEQGIAKFIFWLAVLTVNLAVVNLLPIPPFDGGLLVLTGIEKLRGRAVSDRLLMRLQLAGWALVIMLFLMITWNDIWRLIG